MKKGRKRERKIERRKGEREKERKKERKKVELTFNFEQLFCQKSKTPINPI